MKAVLLRETGGPERLEPGTAPDPEPRDGEVRVRVRACALNHLDLWVRRGLPAYRISRPHILGSDIAGEVAGWGGGVEGLEVGRKVVVAPGVGCGTCPACLAGGDNRCSSYGILGADGGPGGYAEYVVVPARNLLPYPEGLPFDRAAAYPLTYLTAWNMLVVLAGLGPGRTVLIVGAGSGVSLAGLRIARLVGARTLVSTRSPEKAEAVRKLGADDAFVSPPEDLRKAVLKRTDGEGVDVVLEHVGPAVFDKALKSLKRGGTLVTCGATTGPKVELDLRYVYSRELRVLGAKMGPLAEMRRVASLVASGRLEPPPIDATFPLAEARRAHERLESGAHFGKVVLSVD